MRDRVLALILVAGFPWLAWPQGNPLGPEFRVNTYTTNPQDSPSVASDPSGNFVVVWSGYGQDEIERGIFAQRYASSGAQLGGEFHVNTYTTNVQQRPRVASDSSGNFIVAWESTGQDGAGGGVFAQRYAGSGTPLGAVFRVNTYTTGYQFLGSVASDAAGNFVVLWDSPQDGSSSGVFGQRYASSGTPLGPEFRTNTHTTNAQIQPAVASDPAGNLVVVWSSDQDGASFGIFGQRYASSGAAVGPEFRVNTSTFGIQRAPAVAVDPSGSFVVVWETYLVGVFGQRYLSSGTPAGGEFALNTYPMTYQLVPSVASDPSGNFVVVWTDTVFDGSGPGSFGQRFASTGPALAPPFQINTYTTNSQFTGSVATDALGRFVVVWSSQGQDGSVTGVFGQRYAPILPVELMDFKVE